MIFYCGLDIDLHKSWLYDHFISKWFELEILNLAENWSLFLQTLVQVKYVFLF